MTILDMIEKNTMITDDMPEHAIIDGNKIAALYHENNCVGYSAITKGLDDYYFDEDYPELRDKVRDEWIITQIQKPRNTTTNMNYKNILTRYWIKEFEKQNIDKIYMMSAEKIVWEIPNIKSQLLEQYFSVPTKEVLLQNYDYTAKRNKFKHDKETGLYLRHLK